MEKRVSQVVLECIFDLGITVIYAALAGLVIVAVVASDDGPISVWTAALYASLLPAAVIVLVGVDMGLRVMAERRIARERRPDQGLKNRRPFAIRGRKTCLSDG